MDETGRICIPLHDDAGYRFYRLRVRRGADTKPTMQVHFKGGRKPRLLGVIRKER